MSEFPRVVKTLRGEDGASFKFLWQIASSVTYESGFYHYDDYDSVCVSSQVGCNVGCLFCVTGRSVNKRNLTPEEIVQQVSSTDELRRSGYPLKVSFQGMGEPLHNYASVVAAIAKLRSEDPRADIIGISTVGFPKLIDRLRTDAPGLKLQISLHAPDDELRHKLIPKSRGVAAEDVLAAAQRYVAETEGKLVFNYLLLDGINDTLSHGRRLAALVRPYLTTAQLKISRYNMDEQIPYQPSDEQTAERFVDLLRTEGIRTYEFRSKGVDIQSGCGQLRGHSAETGVS